MTPTRRSNSTGMGSRSRSMRMAQASKGRHLFHRMEGAAYTPKPAGFRFYHLHVTCLARGDAGMKNVWPCGLVVAAFASRGLAAWRLPPEASKVPMNGPVGLQAEGWNRRSRRMGRPKLNNCITIWEISRSKSSNLEPQAFSLRKA